MTLFLFCPKAAAAPPPFSPEKEDILSSTTFSTLPLASELLSTLDAIGYCRMTPIQADSLPLILAGRDVIGQGKTGSGKTAAFGLGLLAKLNVRRYCVQALVLCPTRELADQVSGEIRKLARNIHNIKVLTLCGGMPFGPQLSSLEHGAHIVVGTPGRVEEHVRKGTLRLDQLTTLVLDEADRMLEMGFQETLDAILAQMPSQRQSLLFSATYPQQIQVMAQRIMRDPQMVQVDARHDDSIIEQHFYAVSADDQRLTALRLLLLHYAPASALVFCNTKLETQHVADALLHYHFSALALHGDLEQVDRDQTLVRFANNSVSVLVATDVAARGLDIDAVDAVFNYHLAREIEVHVHRIGRTGRAGSRGVACSLYSEQELFRIGMLSRYLDRTIESEPLPDESVLQRTPVIPAMVTLQIDGGKRQKMRPGDILGALTAPSGLVATQVGKIVIAANWSFVAVDREMAGQALRLLSTGKLKGRSFRVRQLGR